MRSVPIYCRVFQAVIFLLVFLKLYCHIDIGGTISGSDIMQLLMK